MNFFSKIAQFFIEILYPQTCLFWNTGKEICCKKCFLEIPEKIRLRDNILSLYFFSEPKIEKLIQQLKYHHSGDIAKIFGVVMAENLEKEFFSNFPPSTPNSAPRNIYLIPIPLSQNDKRYHNHAELLANETKKNLSSKSRTTQIITDLLIKNSKKKQSQTRNRTERFLNMQDTFSFNPEPGNLKVYPNDIFILVDDVTTSGATISEARRVLALSLGTSESNIYAATVAY